MALAAEIFPAQESVDNNLFFRSGVKQKLLMVHWQ
jgi:hypothetical protein